MSRVFKNEFIIERFFDAKNKRHYLNGELSVLHCHHYAVLYSQLALDADETELLINVAEETFYKVISDYFRKHQINQLEDRISIASEYYSVIGLGQLIVKSAGTDSGDVEVPVSHIDAGWRLKWGNYDKPVNYISAGFINAMFSAIFDKPMNYYKAIETQSIVMGNKVSIFKINHL